MYMCAYRGEEKTEVIFACVQVCVGVGVGV